MPSPKLAAKSANALSRNYNNGATGTASAERLEP